MPKSEEDSFIFLKQISILILPTVSLNQELGEFTMKNLEFGESSCVLQLNGISYRKVEEEGAPS